MGERTKRLGEAEDTLVAAMVGKGARKGTTSFGRLGDVIQRPPMWAAIQRAQATPEDR